MFIGGEGLAIECALGRRAPETIARLASAFIATQARFRAARDRPAIHQ
jgi:hypothetical protein